MNSLLKYIVHKIWLITLLALVLVAVYVSLGRVMLPRLHQYQEPIKTYLSEKMGSPVYFEQLQGAWQGFQPALSLRHFSIQTSTQTEPFKLRELVIRLDVWQSMLQWQPVFSTISLEGMALRLRRNEGGQWQLEDTETRASAENSTAQLVALLLAQGKVQIRDAQLVLLPDEGQQKQLNITDWQLHCVQSICSSKGQLMLDAEQERQISFAMNMHNHPGEKDFQLDAYVQWSPLSIEEWLPIMGEMLPVKLKTGTFLLGGKVWLSVENGRLMDVRGAINAPKLLLTSVAQNIAPVEDLQTAFFWRRNEGLGQNSWRLVLQEFGFKWQDEVFVSKQQDWSLAKQDEQRLLSLVADAVELQFFSHLFLSLDQLPDTIRKLLTRLQPRGRLTNAHLQYRLTAKDKVDDIPLFLLEANLDEVGVSAWKNAPAVDGVNGYLKVTPSGGMVDFSSNDFRLFFPNLYSEQWHYQQASGLVRWQNQGRSFWLDGDHLKLMGNTGKLEGKFGLAAPRNGIEPRLDLLVSMRDAPAKPALTYVPDKKVSPELLSWLTQAVQAGEVRNAEFVYSGSAAKGASEATRTMRLDINAEQVDLSYLPDWPALRKANARILVKDKQTHVIAASGQIYDVRIEQLQADFTASEAGGDLVIKSNLSGPVSDGLKLLTETPLRKTLFDLIDDFKAQGDMKLALALAIPLKGQSPLKTAVVLETDNTKFSIPSLNLSFDQIKGSFDYRENAGLNAEQVTGRVFGEPFLAKISSSVRTVLGGGQKQQTQIGLNGAITAKALRQWIQHPLFSRFEGKTDYQAELNFGAKEGNGIVILSDLKGIDVNLPQPFSKAANQRQPLTYMISLDDSPIHYLSYANLLQFALRYAEGSYQQGEIRVGGDPAVFENIPGIRLQGDIAYLDIEQWQTLFNAMYESAPASEGRTGEEVATTKAKSSNMALLKRVRLNVDSLKFIGQTLEQVIIEAEQINRDWLLRFENPVIKGQLIAYSNNSKPTDIKLDYLRLPKSSKEGADPLTDVSPQKLALLDFSTKELSLGEHNYGSWAFNIRPNDKGARIEQIITDAGGLKILGDIDWGYDEAVHTSRFVGTVNTSDVGGALESWGYSRSIEAKEGGASGNLSWPGTPAAFSLKNASGELKLHSQEGRLLEVEGSANVLRLFGIFNFSSLARRLRLDFSDLFKKGYSFDTLKGELAFQTGEVQIADSLIIDGPSAKFKIDGRTDLINEQLDQDMIVVLPVGDNIPIAATIVGAPQVGIPLYLLNKVFGDMFERFTSARYRVTGSWDDPKIELVKMFENRSTKNHSVVEPGAGSTAASQ